MYAKLHRQSRELHENFSKDFSIAVVSKQQELLKVKATGIAKDGVELTLERDKAAWTEAAMPSSISLQARF